MKPKSKTLHGRAAEAKLGKRLARLTPGSGALPGAKGDLEYSTGSGLDFLIESKSTVCDSLSIQRSWLTKISLEALDAAKYPALAIQFVTPLGELRTGWVCIPEYMFKTLVENYKDE